MGLFSRKPKEKEQDQSDKLLAQKILKEYIKYRDGKQLLDLRIIENEKWYKMKHWELINAKKAENITDETEPVTSYLFKSVADKHADAMDNYPEATILDREEDDIDEAAKLTNIIPLELERAKFRQTYSKAWWYKLKQGFAIYGIFWDAAKDNGIGGIDIQRIDGLKAFWKDGIEDIQDSPYFFVTTLMEDEAIKGQYPQYAGKINENKSLITKSYKEFDTTGMSCVIDAYYKETNAQGKDVVHLIKLVDETILDNSKDNPDTTEAGMYEHGKYPYKVDVLFPEDGTPIGFGLIDIAKSPQIYIDKLDQIISKNALVSGKNRYAFKTGGIDAEKFMDMSVDAIYYDGSGPLAEQYAIINTPTLDPFIASHREAKILELKEVSFDTDFSNGAAGGGVTAWGAIAALQEAGNKVSRDMNSTSYDGYADMIYMIISLVAQFHTTPRSYRMEDTQGTNNGKPSYFQYDNSNLKSQELPPSYEGEGMIPNPEADPITGEMTGEMIPDPNYKPAMRTAIFDIKVKPEKTNPFAKANQNQMAKDMFTMGFFDPNRAVEAKLALEIMMFEGKDKVSLEINKNGDLMLVIQQLQEQIMMMQSDVDILSGKGIDGPSTPVEDPNAEGGIIDDQGIVPGQQ